MSSPVFPPQGYTRADLNAAFNWLMTQPENVRALASDSDRLVAMYLRAQRQGALPLQTAAQDAPVSSRQFSSELRSLASGIRDFEGSEVTNLRNSDSPVAPSVPHEPVPSAPAPPAAPAVSAPAVNSGAPGFHPRTAKAISEIREALNLSSDAEAVNALVSLGYKRLKTMIGD